MKLKVILQGVLLFFFSLILIETIDAQVNQDTTSIWTIETIDGNQYSGYILSEDAQRIILKTEKIGTITILIKQIQSRGKIAEENVVEGELWFKNAQEGQDTTGLWTIETLDGNEYIGFILEEDAQRILLKTEKLGTITILVKQIKQREKIDKKNIVEGEFWFENPQATRYLWGPNGYGLKEGEGYYQNILVMANQFSYGITDNVTLGVGTIPVFIFALSSPGDVLGYTPFWITPKVSIPVNADKINVGFGAFAVGGIDLGFGGLFYGSFTYGTRDNNVSLNTGFGLFDNEWTKSPIISISFMNRVSRRTYFLSENYYINTVNEDFVILTVGARTVWNKVSLDYGLGFPIVAYKGNLNYFGIPWLGFSIPVGKLRRGS